MGIPLNSHHARRTGALQAVHRAAQRPPLSRDHVRLYILQAPERRRAASCSCVVVARQRPSSCRWTRWPRAAARWPSAGGPRSRHCASRRTEEGVEEGMDTRPRGRAARWAQQHAQQHDEPRRRAVRVRHASAHLMRRRCRRSDKKACARHLLCWQAEGRDNATERASGAVGAAARGAATQGGAGAARERALDASTVPCCVVFRRSALCRRRRKG